MQKNDFKGMDCPKCGLHIGVDALKTDEFGDTYLICPFCKEFVFVNN